MKIVGSVYIKIQMKPKFGGFAQQFSKTADNCLPCLRGLDFMIDHECIPNIGEQLLYSTKHRTALPISARTTTCVRTFAIAERNARIPSRHDKLVEIVIKVENVTVFSSTEGLFEGIQEFKERNGLLVADSQVNVNREKKCLKVLNMHNEAIGIYHDSKIALYTDFRNQIQVNRLFSSKE